MTFRRKKLSFRFRCVYNEMNLRANQSRCFVVSKTAQICHFKIDWRTIFVREREYPRCQSVKLRFQMQPQTQTSFQ